MLPRLIAILSHPVTGICKLCLFSVKKECVIEITGQISGRLS